MQHYFSKETNVEHNRREVVYKVLDKELKFMTDTAVFSKGKIDFASDLMVTAILKKEDPLHGDVLDVGCGYGTLGISLFNENMNLTMIDVNDRAMDLTRENLIANNVKAKVLESHAYEKVEGAFDYIITNPPIRAGKKVVHEILIGAKDYLKDNGILYFVMNKKHGYESAKKALDEFFEIEVVDKKDGFRVVRCVKK
ncbi:MAG: methyltransferase [Clostridia bacterium]|jgi:16S rRNA (guanine1207-N2)-methyltransferase|nr:methyltransferase [Clostridia bacterium]